MLQVVGIVFAFETRKVKIKVLNDAKYVAIIIYVCSIVVVIYGLSELALSSYLHTSAVLNNTIIIVASSVFLALNFIPKVGLCVSLTVVNISPLRYNTRDLNDICRQVWSQCVACIATTEARAVTQ